MNDSFLDGKRLLVLLAVIFTLSATVMQGKPTKEFPAHWGKPPEIQTQDYVELPADYGQGSSTLRHWINANLEKDKAATGSKNDGASAALYANDFEKAEADKLPDDLMVLGGDFIVKSVGTNKVLELPGSPLDSFGVQFGPNEKENIRVSAKILGTAKGRRAPTFGVGVGGVSGWKLQVAPGKKAIEILKDQESKATLAFDWKTGEWTQLRLQIRKIKDGEWKIEGKAWQGGGEPKDWMISFEDKEAPVSGRSSVMGSPFAGTPIWFDDLRVKWVK